MIGRQRGSRLKSRLIVGCGKDDMLISKIISRIVFKDRGNMGKFVLIEPLEAK